MTEHDGDVPGCRTEIFAPSPARWKRIAPDIVRLEQQAFGSGAFDAEYLGDELSNPENVVVLLRSTRDGRIVGFTYATTIDLMEEGRGEEWDETAYIPDTVIDSAYRGRGLLSSLMRTLEDELRRRGYRFLERDAVIAHGYAAKIERAYRDRIVERGEPHPSPWGPQVHFRIRL